MAPLVGSRGPRPKAHEGKGGGAHAPSQGKTLVFPWNKPGMQTMKKSVTDLLEADLISEEEALANIPEELEA